MRSDSCGPPGSSAPAAPGRIIYYRLVDERLRRLVELARP